MEEDVEDLKVIKTTDSQNSVTTSIVYSADFTDYNSDRNNSSGKETYVIDWLDSDDSEASCRLQREENVFTKTEKDNQELEENTMQCALEHRLSNGTFTNRCKVAYVAQETFTQTSKTIIELAKSEGICVKAANINTLETQTSYISITDTKRIEYKILSSNMVRKNSDNSWHALDKNQSVFPILSNCLEDKSSKFHESDSDENNSENEGSMIVKTESQKSDDYADDKNMPETSMSASDIDDDSLMELQVDHKKDKTEPISSKNSDASETPKSIGNQVDDIYDKVSNCFGMFHIDKNIQPEFEQQWTGVLTPLTEESTMKKESITDLTPCLDTVAEPKKYESIEVNIPQDTDTGKPSDPFKLPPIKNKSLPTSLNFLLSANHSNKINSLTNDRSLNKWEITGNELAAGENPYINESHSSALPNEVFHLPPIHIETGIYNLYTNYANPYSSSSKMNVSESPCESISINEKIRELKLTNVKGNKRCKSPASSTISSREGSKMGDVAHKGCEVLCAELLRKLRSTSWCEIVDTLEEIPRAMERFWNVITELRIADLIRQVTVHVDSPRSQVARTACMTLACILKNTNYTRKPDFYEAITALLVKTGSFSRPVRRAANVALDDIVCGVDFTHAVTALCVHGVGHKSTLVRCASARLLVVCCAVSGGGRGLLRGRPPSAAAARRAALRALADLLQDKATDARKYAERLYIMLRPLANFEAYFLTDVDVEVASWQMKKYDQLLSMGAKDR